MLQTYALWQRPSWIHFSNNLKSVMSSWVKNDSFPSSPTIRFFFYFSPYISFQAETVFTCRKTMTLTFMHWCPKTIQDFFFMRMIIQSDNNMDQFVL
jgi:hypothetical protein